MEQSDEMEAKMAAYSFMKMLYLLGPLAPFRPLGELVSFAILATAKSKQPVNKS